MYAGSITRYYTGLLLNKPGLPLGTFAVNMAGCTILGIMSDVMLIENNFAGDSVYVDKIDERERRKGQLKCGVGVLCIIIF